MDSLEITRQNLQQANEELERRVRERAQELARLTQQVRETQAQLHLALETGQLGTWQMTIDTGALVASELCRTHFGFSYSDSEAIAGGIDAAVEHIHTGDRERFHGLLKQCIQNGKELDVEFRVVWPDQSLHWIHARGGVISDKGRQITMTGVTMDVTQRVRFEQQVLENEERLVQLNRELEQRVTARTDELRQSQQALFQAQNIEAIGRLAGGIAHDFNNLLTGIIGLTEEIYEDMPESNPHRADLAEVIHASQRASELTRQLLAFGRRQVSAPKVLNINTIVTDMQPLLRRMLREDIELILGLDPRLGNVRMDRIQVEQIIINLILNARDAIPRQGQVTIETGNIELGEEYARRHAEVQPGPYVMLSVSDTGVGMDEETMRHMFEPFFTTKEQGKGTGLGLATIYGIVKQNSGDILVRSVLKRGSGFIIYLPRVRETDEERRAAEVQ